MDTVWIIIVSIYLLTTAVFLIALLVMGSIYLKRWAVQVRHRADQQRMGQEPHQKELELEQGRREQWRKQEEARVAEQRRLEQEKQEEARVAEQRRLEQERQARRQAHLRHVSDPANFDSLSPSDRKELEGILLSKTKEVACDFGRAILFSSPRSMRVELYILSRRPEEVLGLDEISKATSGRRKNNEQLYEYYITHVGRCVLTAAEKLFEIHPRIDVVVVSCATRLMDEFGNETQQCFLSVAIERDLFKKFNLGNLSPLYVLERFSPRLGCTADYRLSPVVPLRANSLTKQLPVNAPVSIEQLQTMNPYKFEQFVGNLLGRMGFQTLVTQPSQDGGVDVIAVSDKPLRKGKTVVQCKRFKQSIGVSVVRELVGTMTHEGAMKGIIITTSDFTLDAKDFAQGKQIELIPGDLLESLVQEYYSDEVSNGSPISN